MGHRLIQQARGKGGLRYRAPSFNYVAKIKYANTNSKLIRGEIIDIVNCAGHSAPLMHIRYEDNSECYIPAALGVRVGNIVFSGGTEVKSGNILALGNIPAGVPVFNLERRPFDGGKLVRTSGISASIVGVERDGVVVKMPSKQKMILNPNCRATIGAIAGGARVEKPIVKGGKGHIMKRRRGKLHPVVSGVAMNGGDHPFGGTHRRTKGASTTSRHAPPGRKVGQIAARRTGRKR